MQKLEGSGQTILVVEDDVTLSRLVRKVLEEKGYRVLTAHDGIEAVNVYSRHKGEVALVFSDMVLPKLGGWTVFLKLREISPTVRMVLASGYLDPRAKVEMVRAGARDFIAKPYEPDEMVKVIRAALQGGDR
jgi:DNA-binding NtrC family response regulator